MRSLFDEYGSLVLTVIAGFIVLNFILGFAFNSLFPKIIDEIRYEEVSIKL